MNRLKNIVKIIIVLILLLFIFYKISYVLSDKKSYSKYYDFYNDNIDYDVLFFGASFIYNSINPLELYSNYGILSYNIGNSAETIPQTYWTIKNSLDYHIPKIIIIDITAAGWDEEKVLPDKDKFTHHYYDALPLSKNKLSALNDLFDNKNMMEHLFPFSIYHNRWSSVTESDFHYDYTYLKGMELWLNNKEYKNTYDSYIEGNLVALNPEIINYFEKIEKLCNKHNIKLILLRLPYQISYGDLYISNSYKNYFLNNNIELIDLLENNIINYETDLSKNNHLNILGANKVTNYIGNYLKDNYEFEAHKNEKWDKDLEKYNSYIKNKLIDPSDLVSGLLIESLMNEYYLELNIDLELYKKYDSLIKSIDKNNIKVTYSLDNSLTIYDKNTLKKISQINFDSNGEKIQ